MAIEARPWVFEMVRNRAIVDRFIHADVVEFAARDGIVERG